MLVATGWQARAAGKAGRAVVVLSACWRWTGAGPGTLHWPCRRRAPGPSRLSDCDCTVRRAWAHARQVRRPAHGRRPTGARGRPPAGCVRPRCTGGALSDREPGVRRAAAPRPDPLRPVPTRPRRPAASLQTRRLLHRDGPPPDRGPWRCDSMAPRRRRGRRRSFRRSASDDGQVRPSAHAPRATRRGPARRLRRRPRTRSAPGGAVAGRRPVEEASAAARRPIARLPCCSAGTPSSSSSSTPRACASRSSRSRAARSPRSPASTATRASPSSSSRVGSRPSTTSSRGPKSEASRRSCSCSIRSRTHKNVGTLLRSAEAAGVHQDKSSRPVARRP